MARFRIRRVLAFCSFYFLHFLRSRINFVVSFWWHSTFFQLASWFRRTSNCICTYCKKTRFAKVVQVIHALLWPQTCCSSRSCVISCLFISIIFFQCSNLVKEQKFQFCSFCNGSKKCFFQRISCQFFPFINMNKVIKWLKSTIKVS